VINYIKEDVVDRVKQLTGGKLAYAGIDCVCGDMTQVSTCPLFSSSSSNFICCEIFWDVPKFREPIHGAAKRETVCQNCVLKRGLVSSSSNFICCQTFWDVHKFRKPIHSAAKRQSLSELCAEKRSDLLYAMVTACGIICEDFRGGSAFWLLGEYCVENGVHGLYTSECSTTRF
jgi:hypothetical protein